MENFELRERDKILETLHDELVTLVALLNALLLQLATPQRAVTCRAANRTLVLSSAAFSERKS